MKLGRFTRGVLTPDCMILGAQKAGTSSLYFYLIQHPQVEKPDTKELHFFDRKEVAPIKDYHAHFPKGVFKNKISLEATPRYLYYPGVAERLYRYNRRLKFIVLLRDPVKRAYSAWNMYQQLSEDSQVVANSRKLFGSDPRERAYPIYYQGEFPSFREAVSLEMESMLNSDSIESSLIRRGYYLDQINEYLKYFKKKQFLFLDFDLFKNDLDQVLAKVSTFLKITDFTDFPWNSEPRNSRAYQAPIDEELYSTLLKHFQQKNAGLEELTGLSLPWMHQSV